MKVHHDPVQINLTTDQEHTYRRYSVFLGAQLVNG
jgi:hypothetical protein